MFDLASRKFRLNFAIQFQHNIQDFISIFWGKRFSVSAGFLTKLGNEVESSVTLQLTLHRTPGVPSFGMHPWLLTLGI